MMMKSGKNGFTMIEISVATMITAVVAVVAIPRLIESTEKTYVSEAVSTLKTLSGAQQRRILEKGAATDDCSELDVVFQSPHFNAPVCNADGSIEITRQNNRYTVTRDSSGVLACEGTCTLVASVINLGVVLPTTGGGETVGGYPQ